MPDDVFAQALLLEQRVRFLREQSGVSSPWPKVVIETEYEPRHVLQKATEILDKINRYRKNIAKTGEIPVSRFVGRDITTDEVFMAVTRLGYELSELHAKYEVAQDKPLKAVSGKTPSDVYGKLTEISIALDESFGLRGITPSDVFTRSEQVLALAKFLRQSQNLATSIVLPEKTSKKLPNHALQSVQGLLKEINQAERNLWMKPITVFEVPRRVITPGDVYDAMGVVLAELERIQYRLGLERYFPKADPVEGKTPDDVIYNTELAKRLLPDFSLEKNLYQYDRLSLAKNTNHIFSLTEHILKQLQLYRRHKGIQVQVKEAQLEYEPKSQHVYSKMLEALEKISRLRVMQGLGKSAVSRHPLREISTQEVFDLALLIDDSLIKIYKHAEIDVSSWSTDPVTGDHSNKTFKDVYHNLWHINKLLDTLLGVGSFTPDESFQKVSDIAKEVDFIIQKISTNTRNSVKAEAETLINLKARDVFKKSIQVLELILEAQRRAGMFDVNYNTVLESNSIRSIDVYNQARVIEAELNELKVFLGISQTFEKTKAVKNKDSNDIYKVLVGVENKLHALLHKEVQQ